MKSVLVAIIIAILVCYANRPVYAAEPAVVVSIMPQRYFVQQICTPDIKVSVMVQPGASPHTYEPKPSQMAGLAEAQIYFAIGAPFEQAWLARIGAVNPAMRIVHTEEGIEKIPMAAHHDEEDGRAGHGAAKTGEDGLDPHLWLSPKLVKMQAEKIFRALVAAYPRQKAAMETNYTAFLSRLDSLDRQLAGILQTSRGKQFMVFHPSWGYFARDYGLIEVPVEIEGKDPKPSQLRELIEHARAKNIRVVFAQPQFSQKNARIIAREIGGEVVFADPLAENWVDNLLEVARKIGAGAR